MILLTIFLLFYNIYFRDPIVGAATYYHPSLQGEVMKNGELYDREDSTITASAYYRGDPVVPLDAWIVVCSKENTCIEVQIQDMGLFPHNNIDLSEAAFKKLAPLEKGRIPIYWYIR